MLQAKGLRFTIEDDAESSDHDEEPQPNKSKLFSFIHGCLTHLTKMKWACLSMQEFKMYLSDVYHC